MCMFKIFGVCILAAQLTHGGTGSTKPLQTSASSYDGVKRDISKFYKPESRPFHIGGSLYTENNKVDLSYGSGIDTAKYDKSQSLKVQVTNHKQLSENWSVNTTAGYTFGGDERHTSCKDSLDREYYCGNLTAWSDFNAPENKDNYNVGITFKYSF